MRTSSIKNRAIFSFHVASCNLLRASNLKTKRPMGLVGSTLLLAQKPFHDLSVQYMSVFVVFLHSKGSGTASTPLGKAAWLPRDRECRIRAPRTSAALASTAVTGLTLVGMWMYLQEFEFEFIFNFEFDFELYLHRFFPAPVRLIRSSRQEARQPPTLIGTLSCLMSVTHRTLHVLWKNTFQILSLTSCGQFISFKKSEFHMEHYTGSKRTGHWQFLDPHENCKFFEK